MNSAIVSTEVKVFIELDPTMTSALLPPSILKDEAVLRAPLHLKLKFKTFGGSAIDLGAFQATYIKEPAVDLTARLKPFAQQTGIDIPDAQLPPGEHFIQLGIKDSDGRAVTKIFKLKVAP